MAGLGQRGYAAVSGEPSVCRLPSIYGMVFCGGIGPKGLCGGFRGTFAKGGKRGTDDIMDRCCDTVIFSHFRDRG